MPTTWDAAHKDSHIALSGGNLAATSSAGSGSINAAVYATNSISPTTKQYFEVTVTGTVGQFLSVGVMNGAASLSANIAATNGIAFVHHFSGSNSVLYLNGSSYSTLGSFGLIAGQVVRVAVDRANNKLWWAVNNVVWSGSAVWMGSGGTTDDPNTGTGGGNIATVTGTIFPAFGSAWTGDVATLNAGATAFTYAVPSGFVGIDSSGGTGTTQARVMVLA